MRIFPLQRLDLKKCGGCESVGYLINLGFGGGDGDPETDVVFLDRTKKRSGRPKIGIICKLYI